jgi:urease gamma subunit
MQLTPREFDKLIIHMMAAVALKRKENGIKLNYPEAVAVISAAHSRVRAPGFPSRRSPRTRAPRFPRTT